MAPGCFHVMQFCCIALMPLYTFLLSLNYLNRPSSVGQNVTLRRCATDNGQRLTSRQLFFFYKLESEWLKLLSHLDFMKHWKDRTPIRETKHRPVVPPFQYSKLLEDYYLTIFLEYSIELNRIPALCLLMYSAEQTTHKQSKIIYRVTEGVQLLNR